jgi:hypothetical protein
MSNIFKKLEFFNSKRFAGEISKFKVDQYVTYKWKKDKPVSLTPSGQGFCDALPYTNGQDFITTYVYDSSIQNGVEFRSAYVQCDYVE